LPADRKVKGQNERMGKGVADGHELINPKINDAPYPQPLLSISISEAQS
jgi:hypothetical protein